MNKRQRQNYLQNVDKIMHFDKIKIKWIEHEHAHAMESQCTVAGADIFKSSHSILLHFIFIIIEAIGESGFHNLFFYFLLNIFGFRAKIRNLSRISIPIVRIFFNSTLQNTYFCIHY